jgi:TPR repeat protein
LSLAELYLRGKYVSQDTYKAISIWKGIANQGYKCAHYNLAQAYYFGIGVRRDIAKAINYLDEVIDFDLNAAAFRDIITQTGNRIISSPVFRTELKGCFKVGSILEAEWKYIYAKSNYKGQAYLDALSEVIDIYKSHPSKDSYFWLARLYRELNINSDYIQSEYYFEKAIANGHTYAKYIKSIHEDEDIHYSEYNLYLPFSYNDIIYNDFINSVEGSFKPMKGLQLSDLSDLPTKDRIPELPYIYIAHLVLNGCASLKEIDEIKDQISIWLR